MKEVKKKRVKTYTFFNYDSVADFLRFLDEFEKKGVEVSYNCYMYESKTEVVVEICANEKSSRSRC